MRLISRVFDAMAERHVKAIGIPLRKYLAVIGVDMPEGWRRGHAARLRPTGAEQMEFALSDILRFAGYCGSESWLTVTQAVGNAGQRRQGADRLDGVPTLREAARKLLRSALDQTMHDLPCVHPGRAGPIPSEPLSIGAYRLGYRAGRHMAREGFGSKRHVGSWTCD